MKKRRPRDRMRTAQEVVVILSRIHPVNPFDGELIEVFPDETISPPLSAMIVRECALGVTTRGMAYSLQDLYSILKYSTDIDTRLAGRGMRKFAWRPGGDVVGCGESFAALWKAGYARKFCEFFWNEEVGGRPSGVKWLL